MKFKPQSIPDVVLIDPAVHGDNRGYFIESFRQDQFEQAVGCKVTFVQDNESLSSRGVLRGLHFQRPPHAQAKLVRVIEGEVLDVALDIRHGSPTYGKHIVAKLSAENKHQLFIPRGFAHGFVVLSETAIFSYKVDSYYNQEQDQGIAFDDPLLKIDWQLFHTQLILSEKDRQQPSLAELSPYFHYEEPLYE